jgi:probable HAF family extracellular repeat protein
MLRTTWIAVAAFSTLAVAQLASTTTSAGVGERDSDTPLVAIPALPPMLGHRLKLELRIHDIPSARITMGQYDPPSSVNRANANRHVRARWPSPGGNDNEVTARRFFLTDLGTLGGTESFAYGLNDKGQVVGSSRVAGDLSIHAFLYSDGKMTDLSPLNSGSIQTVGPTGINNAGQVGSGVVVGGVYLPAVLDSNNGQITVLGSLGGVTSFGFSGVAASISNFLGETVGYSYVDATNRHAFRYLNGLISDIGSLGGYSVAVDVNDRGTIVGSSSTDTLNGRAHAFVYTRGVMRDVDPYNGESYAQGVNNFDDVVGQFLTRDQTAYHAFLYSRGSFHDIGFSGSPETVAFAINDRRQIVGVTLVPFEDTCVDPVGGGAVACTSYVQHAFLYQRGKSADLNSLIPADSGWELGWAFDINSHGQIVGYGSINGKFRAFLLTPANTAHQCKKGAWKAFGFKNQGQCIQFVNTAGARGL